MFRKMTICLVLAVMTLSAGAGMAASKKKTPAKPTHVKPKVTVKKDAPKPAYPMVGDKAPEFELPRPEGGTLTLSGMLKDQKALLLVWWACG